MADQISQYFTYIAAVLVADPVEDSVGEGRNFPLRPYPIGDDGLGVFQIDLLLNSLDLSHFLGGKFAEIEIRVALAERDRVALTERNGPVIITHSYLLFVLKASIIFSIIAARGIGIVLLILLARPSTLITF